MIEPTHLVVKPGHRIELESFNLTLSTNAISSNITLNKYIKFVEITGTYGWWPSFSGIGNLINIAWQALVSVGGRMDVVAAFTDKIAISVNNPTFGYPYTVFVDADKGGAERYNYYVGESHNYVDSKGRTFNCARNYDSIRGKEFTIEAVC